MNRVIPEAAVEAAARAMFPKVWGPQVWTLRAHGETPTDARNRAQQEALKQASAALEAAAPHMLAEAKATALEEAAAATPIQWDFGDGVTGLQIRPWLRARAAEIRQ